VGAIAAAVLLLLSPAASAQSGVTLDEAVSAALRFSCAAMGGTGGSYGRGIGTPTSTTSLCPTAGSGAGVQGTSGGSVTSGTSQGLQDEERRLLQRLKDKRAGVSSAASADMNLPGLGVFVSGEFEAFEKRFTTFEPAYNSNRWGGTIGVDYPLTSWIVAGIAFSYSRVEGDFRRSTGGFDTDSYGPLVYAGLVPARNLFVDFVAGYTRKEFLIEREVAFAGDTGNGFVERQGLAIGDPSGDQYTVGLSAGYDFIIDNLTVGPRIGVNYKLTTIDAFTERSRRSRSCLNGVCTDVNTTGLELAYERQQETSLKTVAGIFASLAISTGFGVLIPQSTFEYLHEFEDNQRDIRFRFVEDFQRHTFKFSNDPPDRDHFQVGVGLVALLPGGFSPFVNFRALLGYKDQSSHTVTAGLRFTF
jgi:outer membrane autotransporter protein